MGSQRDVAAGRRRRTEVPMARKHKPAPDLVEKAAKALKNPKTASLRTVRRMAAVLLDDQEFAPQPHPVRPKSG